MQDKNKPGLRFYAPSANVQLRAAMSRAYERGVEWQRVDGILKDVGEDGPEEAIRRLDGLKPLPSSPDDISTKCLLLLRSTKHVKLGCNLIEHSSK
jgi:hypothetical protein